MLTLQSSQLARKRGNRFWRRPDFYLGLLLLTYVILGLLLVTHYGESWDEKARIGYDKASLSAYSTGVTTNLTDEKGPFYGMLSLLASGALQKIMTGWQFIDAWHFMIFLSFVMGVFFFYRLCCRLVNAWAALATTLLFSTQPLIWGHAFINPKDIPFMAFFMGSVALGLEMVDHFFPNAERIVPPLPVAKTFHHLILLSQQMRRDWPLTAPHLRKILARLVILMVALVITYPFVTFRINLLVSLAYAAAPTSWLGGIFSHVAQHANELPVELYVHKSDVLYLQILFSVEIALFLALLTVAVLAFPAITGRDAQLSWTPHRLLIDWSQDLRSRAKAFLAAFTNQWTGNWLPLTAPSPVFTNSFPQTLQVFFQPGVWIASCFLGFANDIRTLGPASGALVAVYLLSKGGKKAIPILLEYLGISAGITYIFWPFLWKSPLANYLVALSRAADFEWGYDLLFGGRIYSAQSLPVDYIQTLLKMQYTETAIAIIAIGAALAVLYFLFKPGLRMDLLVLVTWIVAPIGASLLMHSTVYDNARQFLFVIPAFFILASLTLQNLWGLFKGKLLWFAPLSLLLILPAVYWNMQLHPYEYIYYNSLAGGVQGACRNYELDYWATSYKSDFEYLNQIAPKNSVVYVYGLSVNPRSYVRSDLVIVDQLNNPVQINYAVVLARTNVDLTAFPQSKILMEEVRENCRLSVVKQIQPGDILGKDR